MSVVGSSMIIKKVDEDMIDESFEEILSGFEIEEDVDEDVNVGIETEPLCASCFAPLDVDEDQKIGYCERCQTTVFVERRKCSCSL